MATLLIFVSLIAQQWAYDKTLVFVQSEAKPIEFCDLVNSAEKYDKQRIRVRASMMTSLEGIWLIDSGCKDKHKPVLARYACNTKEECEKIVAPLKGNRYFNLEGLVQVDLLVEGTFSMSEDILDGCPCYGVSISKIIEVTPIPPSRRMKLKG